MGKGKEPSGSFEGGLSDFVPAVFARSVEEAEDYRALLDDHDIPAIIGSDDELVETEDQQHRMARKGGMTQGVPVLVPEVLLDEASEIIADRQDDEEFRKGEDDLFDDEDEDDEEDATPTVLGDGDEEDQDEDDDDEEGDEEEDGDGLGLDEEDDGLGGGLGADDDDE
ncbi:MAG: hypothetical protein LLG01_11365 [Planctomycetaceae bacterium]|nr:hypothetical protein [Planctomycetaceae bacterium]